MCSVNCQNTAKGSLEIALYQIRNRPKLGTLTLSSLDACLHFLYCFLALIKDYVHFHAYFTRVIPNRAAQVLIGTLVLRLVVIKKPIITFTDYITFHHHNWDIDLLMESVEDTIIMPYVLCIYNYGMS